MNAILAIVGVIVICSIFGLIFTIFLDKGENRE